MVKLGSVAQHYDGGQSDVIVSLGSLGLMVCMVVVVLGIKFRWFKQRLDFDPIPTGSGSAANGQVVSKRNSRSSQEQFREPVVTQGIFRKKLDEDVIIERPKTLPPVRVRKPSKGPPTFGPPKRSATPSSIVDEPVVIPPPPPPLPSAASSVTLSSSGGSPQLFAKTRVRTESPDEKQVNFESASTIIANGETNKTYEQLKTEEDQSERQYTERRPTGYIRPTDEINQVLQESDREPPKVQPRSITTDKPKETFKKKAKKTIKTTTEPLKTDEDPIDGWKINQRRLTGFFPPADEDREHLEDLSEQNSESKSPHKVVFLLDEGDDQLEHDIPKPPPPPPISPPSILFSSQLSNDDDRNSSDSWSAIQRHRNLAQTISEQHEAMQNKKRENTEPEFRNPLATQQQQQQQQQPKPRTMRDMRRNNAKNDLLLDSEKGDTEA